jgi:hypothetical protein
VKKSEKQKRREKEREGKNILRLNHKKERVFYDYNDAGGVNI